MNFSQKVALVTGGASGIGACCVEEFLKNNIKGVVIADLGNGEIAAERLNDKYGDGKVIFVKTDVTNEDSFDHAFQETIREYGNIDILLNCAGIIDEINWRKLYQVNVFGYVMGCQLALDKYLSKFGSSPNTYIINIASLLGLMPYATAPNYTASKHAIVGLTRSYGINPTVAKQGICVMGLCPGLTQTPFTNYLHSQHIKYTEFLKEEMDTFSLQRPEVVAKSAVEILQKAENGSIWIINDSVLKKVIMPTYETLIDTTKV